MLIERQLGLEPQGIARPQAASHHAELLARFQNSRPGHRAGWLIPGHIDFEPVLAGVAGAGDQRVGQATYSSPREPIKLDRTQIRVGQLLEQVHSFRTLNGNLSEVVA